MKRVTIAILGAGFVCLGLTAAPRAPLTVPEQNELIGRYCFRCHIARRCRAFKASAPQIARRDGTLRDPLGRVMPQ